MKYKFIAGYYQSVSQGMNVFVPVALHRLLACVYQFGLMIFLYSTYHFQTANTHVLYKTAAGFLYP